MRVSNIQLGIFNSRTNKAFIVDDDDWLIRMLAAIEVLRIP